MQSFLLRVLCDHAISFQFMCAKQKECPDNLTFIGVTEAQEDMYAYTFAANTKN